VKTKIQATAFTGKVLGPFVFWLTRKVKAQFAIVARFSSVISVAELGF